MHKIKTVYLVSALLIILFGLVTFSMRTKSPTCDEFAHHVASGYSYLVTGDFRMNPASPPLPRVLAALPLWFLKAKAPLDHSSWKEGNSPVFAHQFFEVYNHNMDQLIFWARIPIVILSIIFGFFVFYWSRALFGEMAAYFSLILYCFCPDIIAHSGLATADLAVAFFFFMTLMCYWKYLKEPALKYLFFTGVMAGLAFLSKFSAVLLFPIMLLTALLSGKVKEIALPKMLAFLFICFFTVWAGYGFELKPLLTNTPDPAKKIAMYQKAGGEALVHFAEKVSVPLSTFSSAFVSMMVTKARGTHAYLMGQWSDKGWWYYYFVAFLIKNTIPFILLIFASFFIFKKLGLDRLTQVTLLTPVVFFFAATLGDKAQAGIRYFLPIYPLLFLLAGAGAAYLWKKNNAMRFIVAALLSWHAAEAIHIFPDYLAYFNESIGGPDNGYKWLRDSNIDWGQDLKGIGKLAQKEKYPEVVVLTLSPVDPADYGIPYRRFNESDSAAPAKTVYAVGVHFWDSVRWAKHIKPDRIIGHSFFIYDMRGEKTA